MATQCFCNKCGKLMSDTQFYTYKDVTKPKLCKKCITMHIDNFDPDTYVYLLKDFDVPYIPEEWNVLRDKAFAKDPHKMNGMSVFGKYLSKMKLKQWKEYGWADTEKLQSQRQEIDERIAQEKAAAEADLKQQLEEGKISEAEYKTYVSVETQNKELESINPVSGMSNQHNFYDETNFISEEEINPAQELTHDDKLMLAMKWGRLYSPNDWIALEKDYNEMTNSFDIQDADTINTLKLLCKTNLKANQAIDAGDIDGFQKLARVQESLRKTAKFTAAQNKEEKNNYVDSVGELVALCEKEEGFIPRYVTNVSQDVVDTTLDDMNSYIHKLVTQDLGFGQQIEDSLRKIQLQKEMNQLDNEEEEDNLKELTEEELNDEDFMAFYEEKSKQMEEDKEEI
jgi:hypothetical protein